MLSSPRHNLSRYRWVGSGCREEGTMTLKTLMNNKFHYALADILALSSVTYTSTQTHTHILYAHTHTHTIHTCMYTHTHSSSSSSVHLSTRTSNNTIHTVHDTHTNMHTPYTHHTHGHAHVASPLAANLKGMQVNEGHIIHELHSSCCHGDCVFR